MAARPIILSNPKTVRASDEAGTFILKTVLPPTQNASFAYNDKMVWPTRGARIPTLGCFCIRALLDYTDQLHVLGNIRLSYSKSYSGRKGGKRITKSNALKSLLPSWGTPHFSLAEIDPRLWANIVQIYDDLPEDLRTLPIQLADPHLPLLQQIPSTPNFALITTLNLCRSQNLTDENIISLKALHNLCALDISSTDISSHGLRLLSRTLLFNENRERRGPWALRILRMRDCRRIDNNIFPFLKDFPLLCTVDASNTRCSRKVARTARPFDVVLHERSILKGSLEETVQELVNASQASFAHPTPYILSAQEGPIRVARPNSITLKVPLYTSVHNSFYVFPSSRNSSGTEDWVVTGNTDAITQKRLLAEQNERKEDEDHRRKEQEAEVRRELWMEKRARCQRRRRLNPDDSDDSYYYEDDNKDECSSCDEYYDQLETAECGFLSRGEYSLQGRARMDVEFYATGPSLPRPRTFISAPNHDNDIILHRTPPPWSVLETLTPETWHKMKSTGKDVKYTESLKLKQNVFVKDLHLSLTKRRQVTDPQRPPSPTLVNPPSLSQHDNSAGLLPRKCLADSPAGGNVPQSELSHNIEKKPQMQKRPRLKLEPEDTNPFASHKTPARPPFKLKPPGESPGASADDCDATGKTNQATSKTPRPAIHERKSGTSKVNLTDEAPKVSRPRSKADCTDKKVTKHSGATKPAFDWKGWSNNLKS